MVEAAESLPPLLLAAIALVFGYFSGSIPFGLIIARLFGLGDIRKIGSGNIGMTNVLRTGRKELAFLTLLCDALKGTLPVLLFHYLSGPLDPYPPLAAGLGAFVGHLLPVWLRWRGGKGVAVYLGVLLALTYPGFLAFALIWLSCAALTRYSSLSALLATLAVPLLLFLLGQPVLGAFFCLMSVLVFIKHAANIQRLRSGTESRMGSKGKEK